MAANGTSTPGAENALYAGRLARTAESQSSCTSTWHAHMHMRSRGTLHVQEVPQSKVKYFKVKYATPHVSRYGFSCFYFFIVLAFEQSYNQYLSNVRLNLKLYFFSLYSTTNPLRLDADLMPLDLMPLDLRAKDSRMSEIDTLRK